MNREERKEWLINNQNLVNEYIFNASSEDSEIICKALPHFDYKMKVQEIACEIRNAINKELENFDKSNCEIMIKLERFNNILNKLRTQIYESVICFYIDNGYNVIDYDEFTDHKTKSVNISDEILDSIVKKAKENNANIYMLHNHPIRFNAIPSPGDLSFNKKKTEYFKNNGIEFIDDCIITIDDYWSYAQTRREKEYDA